MSYGKIKIERAITKSNCSGHARTAIAILNAIPDSVKSKLSSTELGNLMDAMWIFMSTTKQIAYADACDDGAIWDAQRQELREIC